jgi:hypothetical protein
VDEFTKATLGEVSVENILGREWSKRILNVDTSRENRV